MLLHIKNDKYTIKDLQKFAWFAPVNKWEARYIAGGNNRCGQQNNFFLNLFIYPSFLTKINVILFFIVTFILVMVFAFFLFIIYLGLGREYKNNIKNVVLRCRVAFLIEWYFFYNFILFCVINDWIGFGQIFCFYIQNGKNEIIFLRIL